MRARPRSSTTLAKADLSPKRRNPSAGSSAVIVAIMIPILLAGLGLVVDSGLAFDLKRRLQKAADAGAVAAAQELRRGHYDRYQSAALHDAAANGFGRPSAQVSVLNPPVSGERAGDASFVEVRVRSEADLFFMRGFRDSKPDVEAVAIAGAIGGDACLFTLDPSGSRALWATGTANVDLGKCGIHVNSDSASAARTDGGATIKASTIDVVGGYSGSGFLPDPVTESNPESDPWADIVEPHGGSCTFSTTVKVTSDTTLSPGVYCGGISVTGKAVATLQPGNYYINGGGLKVAGGASLVGEGVSFYLSKCKKVKYDGVDFSGNASIQLSANPSGPMAGILFFQDRAVTNGADSTIAGTPDSSITGGLYFATTTVKFAGNGASNLFRLLAVVHRAEFHGSVDIAAPDPNDGLMTPNILRAVLVH
jgi:hypothetical protein